jgi:hypothetical protein
MLVISAASLAAACPDVVDVAVAAEGASPEPALRQTQGPRDARCGRRRSNTGRASTQGLFRQRQREIEDQRQRAVYGYMRASEKTGRSVVLLAGEQHLAGVPLVSLRGRTTDY